MQVDTIKKSAEFKIIQASGSKYQASCFILLSVPSATSRVGFTVSKKVGNSVIRSYVKRKLKHAVMQANLESGFDYVIIAKRSSIEANFQSLIEELNKAAKYLAEKSSRNV